MKMLGMLLALCVFGAVALAGAGCYVEDRPDTVIRETPSPPDVVVVPDSDQN